LLAGVPWITTKEEFRSKQVQLIPLWRKLAPSTTRRERRRTSTWQITLSGAAKFSESCEVFGCHWLSRLSLRRLAEALFLCEYWSPLRRAVLAREMHTPKAHGDMDCLHPKVIDESEDEGTEFLLVLSFSEDSTRSLTQCSRIH
jgi:hypothetical protein